MKNLEDLENAISLLIDIEVNHSNDKEKDVKYARKLLEKFRNELLKEQFKNELEKKYLEKELERTRNNLSIEESKNNKLREENKKLIKDLDKRE